jgi:hypothetical protein
MSWIAIVLGSFLFYQFVERRHKIVMVKIAGLLLLLGGVSIGGFFGYNMYKDRQGEWGIAVEQQREELKLDKVQEKKIVNQVFEKISESVGSRSLDLSPADQEQLKQLLYDSFVDRNWTEIPDMMDDEYQAYLVFRERKDAESRERLSVHEEMRRNRILGGLPEKRVGISSIAERLKYHVFLGNARDSFFLDEFKTKFSESLLPEEQRGLDLLAQLQELANEGFYEAINNSKDLQTTFSFKVCNKRAQPLKSYSFSVSGFEKNRSTAHALRYAASNASSTPFNGDIIVGPNTCSVFEWTNSYKLFDRYEISDVSGRW